MTLANVQLQFPIQKDRLGIRSEIGLQQSSANEAEASP